jgi:hypothetical protein
LRPTLDTVQSYMLWASPDSLRDASLLKRSLYLETLGLSMLFAGTTLLARSTRLAKGVVGWGIKERGDRAEQFSALIQIRPPVWPVVLSGAAFLYLWWLAALIFDLGFVWQRYVRHSVALKRLGQWRRIRTNIEAASAAAANSASPSK